jgi:hypothetical protein
MKYFVTVAVTSMIFAAGCSSNSSGIVGDWVNDDSFTNGQLTATQKTEMKFRPNGTMRQITDMQTGKATTKITMTGRYTLTDSNIQVKVTTMALEGNYTKKQDVLIGLPPESKNISIPYTLKSGTLTTETKGKKMAFRRAK